MSRDDLPIHLKDSLTTAEDEIWQIQRDIDKLNDEKEHKTKENSNNKKQELLEERQALEEENKDLIRGVRSRRQLIDIIGLTDIVLVIIMILLLS